MGPVKTKYPKQFPGRTAAAVHTRGPWAEALVPTPNIPNASIVIMVVNGAVATAVTANQAPAVNGGGAAQAPATTNNDAASSQAPTAAQAPAGTNNDAANSQAPAANDVVARANVQQAAAPKEKQWPHVYDFRGQNIQLLSGVEKKPLPSGNEHSGDVVQFSKDGTRLVKYIMVQS